MRPRSLWYLVLLLAGSLTLSAGAGTPGQFDWPQWQGPQRTAMSQETGLLKSWPKGGPALLWKSKGLGEGFSTPSVAKGRIYTMGNREKTEYVVCLAEKDGKELWATAVGPVRSGGGGYPGPRCTPTVEGGVLYALGLNGDLLCLATEGGSEVWRKDIRKEFSGSPGGWGYSESPLIDGEKLLVTPGGKKNTIVALNKKTGELIWSSQVPEGDGAAYSSIIVADVDGQRQYIQFLSRGVVGVAAKDGTYLWRYNNPANGTANITTPIFHDNHVFAASAYSTGGGLAKLTRDGDKTTAKLVYFTDEMMNHHGGVIFLDGYLYGNHQGKLACLEFKTGKVQWMSALPGKGSIAYADGRFYYRNEGGKGNVCLIEANPQKYVEHGRFEQPERSKRSAWAHPVIANGRLYIADQDVLLCYDIKARAQQ